MFLLIWTRSWVTADTEVYSMCLYWSINDKLYMGPQGEAEIRTINQTSDIILFNIEIFFISKLAWTCSFKYSQTRDSWSQRRHNGHKSWWSRKLFGAHLLHKNFVLGGWGGGDPMWAQRNINWAPTQQHVTKDRKLGLVVTCLCGVLQSRLLINVFLVCDVLYDLLRSHQLLCFCIWDLKACSTNKLLVTACAKEAMWHASIMLDE